LLAVAATAAPLVMPEPTFAADTVKVGTCLLQKCQKQLAQVRGSLCCDARSSTLQPAPVDTHRCATIIFGGLPAAAAIPQQQQGLIADRNRPINSPVGL
jgi:hypothetical protein